ncbi:hypothetical protein [Hoeflea alexandrii]|uniref:hypothetical protein n=1 Tax=Hoeflea alexandrii TaxID=288436 RepID=UPI0022B07164|nr:hypothetical protein [Hoeflea alexandrii]MCZ4287873.1 hypothetical protein [Hoeflea alexandrii]
MELVDFAKENWTVIERAPWVFVGLAVIFFASGFSLAKYIVAEKVANLESRLAARDDKISSLTEQLTSSAGEVNGDGRYIILGHLEGQYLSMHPESTRRMQVGLESPPSEWVNAELEKLGADWRVKRDPQGRNVIFDPAKWG